jgi:hypothetical protein
MTDGIHDPAQAWNALTVSGYTDKVQIDAIKHPGWEPLAARGDLSPASCTSMTWGKWPIKPDIVMEAGNMARNAQFAEPDYIDEALQLLSASKDFGTGRPLTSFATQARQPRLPHASPQWSGRNILTFALRPFARS